MRLFLELNGLKHYWVRVNDKNTLAIDICKILIPALVKCFCVDDQASSISALLSYRYEFHGSSIPSCYVKL